MGQPQGSGEIFLSKCLAYSGSPALPPPLPCAWHRLCPLYVPGTYSTSLARGTPTLHRTYSAGTYPGLGWAAPTPPHLFR
jgi:hypothetical protein